MKSEKKEQMFAMFVDDWSLPGFVSGGISYLGTMEDFEGFLANVRENNEKMYAELTELFEKFRAGETEVEHNVAYGNHRFLSPVTVYRSKKMATEQMKWACQNIWDCPYYFRAKNARMEHLWVAFQEDDRSVYARYHKVCFQGIVMGDAVMGDTVTEDRNLEYYAPFWGYPGLIALGENGNAETTLYLPERYFADEQAMRSDMADPVFDPESDLRSFLFAIVGDG